MSGHDKTGGNANDEPITCTTCQAEVPASAAHTFEGSDYVQHFCGLECLISWKDEKGIKDDQPKP